MCVSGLPDINLNSRILHVYPILFVHQKRSKNKIDLRKNVGETPTDSLVYSGKSGGNDADQQGHDQQDRDDVDDRGH